VSALTVSTLQKDATHRRTSLFAMALWRPATLEDRLSVVRVDRRGERDRRGGAMGIGCFSSGDAVLEGLLRGRPSDPGGPIRYFSFPPPSPSTLPIGRRRTLSA